MFPVLGRAVREQKVLLLFCSCSRECICSGSQCCRTGAALQLQSLQEEIVSCCSEANKWPLST